LPTLNETINSFKEMKNLKSCLEDMALNCSPKNYFSEKVPSLKAIWRWLKDTIKEYMDLKKQ
jgi:hypothetical protein